MKTAKYSESTLLILVGSLLLTLLIAPLAKAGDVDFKWQIPLLESAERIRLGDSASAISGKLEPTWIPINTNIFLRDHPFNLWVPYTNLATVLEWESKEDGRDGWPCIVFAVFSDAQKTNLVDALLHDGNPGVRPLVGRLLQPQPDRNQEGGLYAESLCHTRSRNMRLLSKQGWGVANKGVLLRDTR